MSEETTTFEHEDSGRPLAYIATILGLYPIENADSIECARVLGWEVVVRKGLYKVGDKVIYIEIDSLLPKWQNWIDEGFDKRGFRIKTIKLRGQVSQGMCAPLEVLELNPNAELQVTKNGLNYVLSNPSYTDEVIELVEGYDVTSLLEITKYVPSSVGKFGGIKAGTSKGSLPSFIRKTDQARIQNCYEYPSKYPDIEWEMTEKLEGSSCTVYYLKSEDKVGVCSRNLEINIELSEESDFVKTAKRLGLFEILRNSDKSIALQGELIGAGIHGNIYKLQDTDFKIFDVFLIDEYRYALPSERYEILAKLDLLRHHAPILGTMKLAGLEVSDVLKLASALLATQEREGVVFKSCEMCDVKGAKMPLSFKAISQVYELKQQ